MNKDYLSFEDIADHVIDSWSKCLKINVARELNVDDTNYKQIEDCEFNLALFQELVSFINCMINDELVFLITDQNCVLLDMLGSKKLKGELLEQGIKRRFSFSEKCIGTNAISLTQKFKRPVYLEPKYNYCNLLKNLYSFAVPLKKDGELNINICVITVHKNLSRNIIVIGKLLAFILDTIKDNSVKDRHKFPYKLSDRQLQILKLIAGGFTERGAANKLKLSVNTIKYHKRVLLKKLNVQSIIEAIVRSLKLGLISVDEIDIRTPLLPLD